MLGSYKLSPRRNWQLDSDAKRTPFHMDLNEFKNLFHAVSKKYIILIFLPYFQQCLGNFTFIKLLKKEIHVYIILSIISHFTHLCKVRIFRTKHFGPSSFLKYEKITKLKYFLCRDRTKFNILSLHTFFLSLFQCIELAKEMPFMLDVERRRLDNKENQAPRGASGYIASYTSGGGYSGGYRSGPPNEEYYRERPDAPFGHKYPPPNYYKR